MSVHLSATIASGLARIALGHVTREYPNKLDHVLQDADDLRSPRAMHPIFYGSFDWHSCVHSYWLLARLHRRFPDVPEAEQIRSVVDAHFTPANVAGELAYLARPSSKTFERPYGWAWLLKLAAELAGHAGADGKRWQAALAPLADAFAERFLDHLPQATYPIRAGTHFNTAFALALALEYAEIHHHPHLVPAIKDKALAWYGDDIACQAWEPNGDDFLSPTLVEAECMRRVLPPEEFSGWLSGFLPHLAAGEPKTLFVPARVSNRSDGKIAHLDGLNLSRAWCFRSLARTLDDDDPRQAVMLDAANAHLEASLPYVTGDYMGEHWLATYALLALDTG
jgi:hypothetical protein